MIQSPLNGHPGDHRRGSPAQDHPWDDFEFDRLQIKEVTEFLRLCRRWLVDWADKYERDGD